MLRDAGVWHSPDGSCSAGSMPWPLTHQDVLALGHWLLRLLSMGPSIVSITPPSVSLPVKRSLAPVRTRSTTPRSRPSEASDALTMNVTVRRDRFFMGVSLPEARDRGVTTA